MSALIRTAERETLLANITQITAATDVLYGCDLGFSHCERKTHVEGAGILGTEGHFFFKASRSALIRIIILTLLRLDGLLINPYRTNVENRVSL